MWIACAENILLFFGENAAKFEVKWKNMDIDFFLGSFIHYFHTF